MKLFPGTRHSFLFVPRKRMRQLLIACIPVLLAACSARPAACASDGAARAYERRDIGEQWIDYVWVQVPAAAQAGSAGGRLFIVSADPVGAIVPTMIELPCASAKVDYSPAPVEFEIGEDGSLRTSYAWGSCGSCSECYMRWNFSLDLDGRIEGDALVADLVLNETFHDAPMKITSLRMPEVTSACTEPRLACEPGGECGEIEFQRPSSVQTGGSK